MASLNCFCPSWKKKKKNKEKYGNALHVKVDHVQKCSETDEYLRSTSFSVPLPFHVTGSSSCSVKVMNHVAADSGDVDYEGGDEHDEASRLRHSHEFNSGACSGNLNEEKGRDMNDRDFNFDPGTGEARFWASPELDKTRCSTADKVVLKKHSSSIQWRVEEWVKETSSQPTCLVHSSNDDIHFPSSPESDASQPRGSSYLCRPPAADTVIRSLATNSAVAHITALRLPAIPSISQFSRLRSVNLSANLIVYITPGSLPKGLHVLNLSRNKISTIEGLRDLTCLRVLDLSYNRISKIGQGLSKCTLIKELYLAGNKISTVEGLHRLLKLSVLDLSFNKITTAKALCQLVANYSSLIAVNLLGNRIQSNMSHDLLRKTLCSLLPKLALLNKHPIKTQKAREIFGDSDAKAALRSCRRKPLRKGASSSSHSVRRSSAAVSTSYKSKHESRSHSRHHSTLKGKGKGKAIDYSSDFSNFEGVGPF